MSASDDCSEFAQRARIREQCNRFESARRSGQQPSIEAHLEQAPEADRPELLRELIAVEITLRRERGENPSPLEYHERFPEDAAMVEAAFSRAQEEGPPADAIGSPRQASNPDTARNLLFGILALQNNFIDRAALLAAFNAWTDDKSRSLGLILVELGKLDTSRHVLLDALVAEHLKINGEDPDRSLAAISSLGPVRRDLEHLADPDLAASLGHVGTSRSSSTDPDATLSWIGTPTSSGARFRVLRPYARGGLGEVFAAFDEELQREVALKRIQDHHADDPDSRARFLQEAEITGGLEHPGVVPVYGLGQYDNGRPFYAMRMVKGDSLRTAIKQFHEADQDPKRDPGERTVSLRRLLGRFLDVCNAIGYAHSRGVLHRDLKPNNILLGKYGETLIIDWGLAKIVGRPEHKPEDAEPTLRPPSGSTIESTRAGSAIGTPGYMSPEQARGDIDKLGPASDVFSLGATLYHLLTGQPAFHGEDFADRLQKNQRCEFSPPRVVNSRVPRPLEAICLKAMSLQPEDRYASPSSFAEDIEHWLADEPVKVLPESRSQRATRWARRHRAATQAAAGALVVISAVAIVSALLINQARRGERAALDDATAALAAETRAKTEAQIQRERAEDREQLAIDAVKKFRDAVEHNPELDRRDDFVTLRGTLLRSPLQFFRSLRDQLESSHDTRPEALSRLASANFELAGTISAMGNTSDALRALQELLPFQERLLQEQPNVDEFQAQLGRTLDLTGQLQSALGQRDQAIDSFHKALGVLEPLAARNPTVIDFQKDLGTCYFSLGWHNLFAWGQPVAGLEFLQKGVETREPLAHGSPPDDPIQEDLAVNLHYVGSAQTAIGQTTTALATFQKANEMLRRLKPADYQGYDPWIGENYLFIGNLQSGMGRPDEALTSYRKALRILEPAAHMKRAKGRNNLAGVYAAIGDVLGPGKPSVRIEWYQKALDVWDQLARENPMGWYLASTARVRFVIGEAQSELGQPVQALRSYQKAAEIQERLVGQPEMRHAMVHLGGADIATTSVRIAELLSQAGRKNEASQSFEKALALYEKLVRTEPAKGQSDDALVAIYDAMGNLLSRMGRPSDEVEARRKALAIHERRVQAHPRNLADQLGSAMARNYIGNLYVGTGQVAEAGASLRESLDILERLNGDNPESAELASSLGLTLHWLSGLDLPRDWNAAREKLRQGIKHQKRAISLAPGNAGYRGHLRNQLVGLRSEALGHADAAQAAEAALDYAPLAAGNVAELYETATSLISCMNLAKTLPERDSYAKAAIEMLRSAIAAVKTGTNQPAGAADLLPLLVKAHKSIRDLSLATNRRAEAIESYRKAQDTGERLVREQPNNPQYQLDLAASFMSIGNLLDKSGRKTEASHSFEKALAAYEKLVGTKPDKGLNDDALVAIHEAMGNLSSRMGRPVDSLKSFQRALAIREPLAEAQPKNLPYQVNFAWMHANVGKLLGQTGRKLEALQSIEKALAIYERLVRAGMVARNPGELYNYACLFSLCVPLAKDRAERDRFASDAMQTLRTAVAAGWSRAVWTGRDPDLIPLHDRDDFRRLLGELFDIGFPANPFAP